MRRTWSRALSASPWRRPRWSECRPMSCSPSPLQAASSQWQCWSAGSGSRFSRLRSARPGSGGEACGWMHSITVSSRRVSEKPDGRSSRSRAPRGGHRSSFAYQPACVRFGPSTFARRPCSSCRSAARRRRVRSSRPRSSSGSRAGRATASTSGRCCIGAASTSSSVGASGSWSAVAAGSPGSRAKFGAGPPRPLHPASREIGALAAIVAYVFAVGWQPSVVRAGVAGALASLAWLAARPRDRWYFLLLGAAVLEAWNPYSVYEPGFQLSFAAVGAIFVLVPRLEKVLEGYPGPKWLAEIVAVSGACGLVTAPLLLVQFGTLPVYSVLSNALAAPVVGISFSLALATAALAQILPAAAIAGAWVNGWLAAYVAACARAVSGLPGAQIDSRTALVVAAVAAGLAVAWLRLPRRRRSGLVVLAGTLTLVAAAWQIRPQDAGPPPTGFRMTVLDVGQGDGILLEVREGAVLVDEGPPEAEVDDQLRRLGVRRLALLV